MNMSYCRFQNTLTDLRDCQENMDDSDLSPEELAAKLKIIKICREIVEECGEEE